MIAGRLFALAVVVAVLAAHGAQPRAASMRGGQAAVQAPSIDSVLAAHRDSLLALPDVVGVAIGLCEGQRCIKVMLAKANAATSKRIPSRLEGVRVVTEVSGTITPR